MPEFIMFEKDFLTDICSSQSSFRGTLSVLLKFALLIALISSAKLAFATDWTPCEAPCNDAYTNIYTPSPASGSTQSTGDTVRFTINVARDGASSMSTFLPFQPQVSTSGGSGWSASLVSPTQHCIYGSFAQSSCTNDLLYTIKFATWPNSPDVDIDIDVTIGSGTTRVTVKLDNALEGSYISPVFYFDVTGVGGVRVTGLTDMNGTWNGSGDATNDDDVCIYSGAGNYDILVEGPTDSGNYVLESGANKIPITVYWNDDTGTTGRTTLNSADDPSISGATGADTSSQTCSGGNTANISWKALESDLQTKPAGTYSATMTITATAP